MFDVAIFALVAAVFGGAMALAVAFRERRSLAHWAFVFGMLALALESVFSFLSLKSLNLEAGIGLETFVCWQTYKAFVASFVPGIWLLFSLLYARGNAKEFLVRWRFVVAGAFLIPLGLAIWGRNDLVTLEFISPASRIAIGRSTIGMLLKFVQLAGCLLILINLERTFRASVGIMRWRIKFMIVGLGILFLARAYTSCQGLLFHWVDPALSGFDSGALIVAVLLIPMSMLRSGYFEVNVYPSHSVIFNSLILLVAGIYLVALGLFAKIVQWYGGETSFAFKALILLVGVVSLTVLLLSERVRLYAKRFVSRHFQRPMYDYRTVWRRFTECTASPMNQTELCRAASKLVAEIFQVLSISIWVVDEQRSNLVFGASTSFSDAKGAELTPPSAEAMEVIHALEKNTEPMDIDASTEGWAATLRRCHPEEFLSGGSRVCVPMVMGGQVLGVMTLGDRVGGMALTHQDLDLLKCVGDQMAASLRNLQLSGKLLEVKEMEAFQTMSAFFVHDLKNTASTLGLMLKNLPVHFNDPAFREDALRGVSKTVNHINSLIQRLSMLRHGLEVKRSEADLNEVTQKALAAHGQTLQVELIKDFQPLPKLMVDSEQLTKVITNLVINASEASPKQGQVRLQTSQSNGWVVLAVVDNGCGMSPEFLSRSLFRPFQTTKKAGLGIGMFQSKMIVEAHGGRIEVESAPGKGTTFRVLLPIQKK